MRKTRLLRRNPNYHQWKYILLIILLFWTTSLFTMGLAQRRSKSSNTETAIGGGLSENRKNTLKDRLYYSPPAYNYNINNNNNQRNQASFNLRSEDESIYPLKRRGTSTISSSLSSYSSSSSSHLDNSMSKKLFEKEQQLQENRLTTMTSSSMTSSLSTKKQRKKSFPPRAASVNNILRLDPSHSIWDEATSICHTVPGLTKDQMELCFKNPEATKIALQGLSLATDECAYQMSKNRWNCSSLQGKPNPHSTLLFKKGYRESAFGHAIASAGVAYAIAKACSQGNLLSCGCGFQYDDQVNFIPSKDADYSFDESNESSYKRWNGGNSISSWKWSGCSHNMDYGIKFAKIFLDSREKSTDLPSRINLHNNKVGRLAVSSNMEVRCKCHGLSGSCELRTCWRSAPEFRQVGSVLKNKFRRAVMIDQSELGNRPLNRVQKLKKQRRKRRDRTKRNSGNIDLWYYERSPTYCESNRDFSIPGTTGRICNKTGGRDMGSCSTLCCGRGYNTIRQVYTSRCRCQFMWCCEVRCSNCTVDEWITVCK